MPSERALKAIHTPLFVLIAITSIVTVAISGTLVGYYNHHGYPDGPYKPRIRILLVAAVWSTVIALFLLLGFLFAAGSILFGVLSHFVLLAIAFILFIIGAASTTALTDKITCSKVSQGFARCNIVKGLVIVSWIDTIFIFLAFVFILFLAFKARGGLGMTRSTLVDA